MKKILLLVTLAATVFAAAACVLSFFEVAFPLWSGKIIGSGLYVCDPVGLGMIGAKDPFEKVKNTFNIISKVSEVVSVDWSVYAIVIIAYVAAVTVPLTGLISVIVLLKRKKLGKNNLSDGIMLILFPMLLMAFGGTKWKDVGVAAGALLPVLLICGVTVVACTAISLIIKEKR